MATDDDGREYGPTQAELEKVFGAAAFAALQAFLEAHGLSIVRLKHTRKPASHGGTKPV